MTTCCNCRFFRYSDVPGRGSCHRYPPNFVVTRHWDREDMQYYYETETDRPWVDAADWCGEFKKHSPTPTEPEPPSGQSPASFPVTGSGPAPDHL